MNAHYQQLCQLFAASLEISKDVRSNAEQQLSALTGQAGFMSLLFEVISNPATEFHIAQSAALYMKNILYTDKANISETDLEMVRQNIVRVLLSTDDRLEKNIASAIEKIVNRDYPSKFNPVATLNEMITMFNQINSEGVVVNGVANPKLPAVSKLTTVALLIIKRCSWATGDVANFVGEFMNLASQTLTGFIGGCLGQTHITIVSACLRKVIKLYKHSIQSPYFKSEVHARFIAVWVQAIATTVANEHLALCCTVQNADGNCRQQALRVTKWCMYALNILYSKTTKKENAKDAAIAVNTFLSADCQNLVITNIYTTATRLVAKASLDMESDGSTIKKALGASLDCLTKAVDAASAYKVLKAGTPAVLEKIIFPLLSYDIEETDDRVEDPSALIKAEFDFYNRMYEPKEGAANFLRVLLRNRGKDWYEFVATYMVSTLNTCGARVGGPNTMNTEPSLKKYAALRIFSEISKRLTGKKRNLQIESTCYQFIAPEMQLDNADLWLRTVAVDAIGYVLRPEINERMARGEIESPENFIQLVTLLIQNCRDSDPLIKNAALTSLAAICDIPSPVMANFIAQNAAAIIEVVLEGAASTVSGDAAMVCLDVLICQYPAVFVQHASAACERIAASFMSYLEECNNAEARDDSAASEVAQQALGQCAATLSTIVTTVSCDGKDINEIPEGYHNTQATLALFPALHPVIIAVLDDVKNDWIINEIMDILAVLTYNAKGQFNPAVWTIFDMIYRHICGDPNNINWYLNHEDANPVGVNIWEAEVFLGTIDNFVSGDFQYLMNGVSPVFNKTYSQMYFEMIRALVSTEVAEDCLASGLSLMWFVVDASIEFGAQNMPFMHEIVSHLNTLINNPDLADELNTNPSSRIALANIFNTMIMAVGDSFADALLQSSQNILFFVNLITEFDCIGSETRKLYIHTVNHIINNCPKIMALLQGNVVDYTTRHNLEGTVVKCSALEAVMRNCVTNVVAMNEDEEASNKTGDEDYDSEQELDDNEDASDARVGEDEFGDYDFDVPQLMFGVRKSPLDNLPYGATVTSLFQKYGQEFTNILGAEYTNKAYAYCQNQQ